MNNETTLPVITTNSTLPRIVVYPRELYPYPCRTFNAAFVLPYDYRPNAVRRCDFRLVREARPSGTVIVPRMGCWWARR